MLLLLSDLQNYIPIMTYPISVARKAIYDAIIADIPTIPVYDSMPDAEPPSFPFVVMDGFSMANGSKCGYDVTCLISVYDTYNRRGGLLESDQVGNTFLRICEQIGFALTVTTTGVRTFNRANYRTQFSVTLKDV